MRWKCTCSYDGTSFAGWQTQSGQESVQQVLEEALAAILKSPVSIHGSGRTDAGVHALEQVFHFDWDWRHGGDRLVKALYSKLPRSIQVRSATEADDTFHARFSAVSKRYEYRLFLGQADPFAWPYCWSVPERVDLNLMTAAMELLVGQYDFAAFAANRGVGYESTVRTLTEARMSLENGYVKLKFSADGFMYKMVRSLAGTMVNVGMRRLDLPGVESLLANAQRTPMVQAAPARGLFLEKVLYAT